MPFNFKAEEFVLNLCKLGRPGFRIDLFDYGFYSADDVQLLPVGEWNRLMVRNYGGQLTHRVRHGTIGNRGTAEGCAPHNVTVDLNFLQLIFSLASHGLSAKIEKQKDYAEKVLGIPLGLSETSKGLDYAKAKNAMVKILEDDGFYHLRAGR